MLKQYFWLLFWSKDPNQPIWGSGFFHLPDFASRILASRFSGQTQFFREFIPSSGGTVCLILSSVGLLGPLKQICKLNLQVILVL